MRRVHKQSNAIHLIRKRKSRADVGDDVLRANRDGEDPSFEVLEENNASIVADRIERLEKIISLKKEAIPSVLDDERNAMETSKKYAALLERVDQRISHSHSYCRAISLTIFCIIYTVTLLWQIDNDSTCGVEIAVINNIINSLPGGVQGGFLSSTDDFWSFLSDSVLGATFKDPKCGDGSCDIPTEFPGFGRFGCIADCGRYAETTTISIDLGDFVYNEVKYNPSKEPCSVENPNPPCQYLGAVNRSMSTSPKFKYNIYSTTMGDYLWDQDVDVNKIRRVEVPDGDFQLYLYQTQKSSEAVDLVDIYQALNTVPSTVPARSAERDFDYGDPREYLASTSALISDINEYCWGPNQAAHNYACDWHPALDTTITALASYGVAGSVLMSTGMRKTSTLAEVNFCGALPKGNMGLTDTANRDYLRSLAIACPHRRHLPPSIAMSLSESTGSEKSRAVGTGALGSRCVSHSQCDQTVRDPFYNHTGLFCARSSSSVNYGTCAYCAFCQADSAGISPCLAQCGLVGDAPECISAARLVADFQCQSTFNFSVYRYNPPGQAPTVVPGSQATLPELTQHNLLVGPLMVTQVRRAHVPCSAAGSGPLRALVNRTSCLGPRDGSPFGVDPTYLPASQTYNGKLLMTDAYNSSEVRAISTTASSGTIFTKVAPYGFFPHQYDGMTFGPKEDRLVSQGDVDTFKVYFDGVLTLSQATAMLSYMQDGGFIDNQTSSVSLDMITYSSDLNLFSILVITFDWQDGGSISWDYRLHSRRVDLYTSAEIQRGLEYTSLVLLGLFMVVDLRRFYVRLHSAKLGSLFSFDTALEWGHWALMAYTWATWYRLCDKAAAFRMLTQQDYWVLANPTANTRMLLTNATSESSFLSLHALVTDYVLSSSEHYNALASCSLVLFVIRVLRSLEFQAHLGVITRTITAAWSNLLHFVVLLVAVFIGYAVAGHLIFGHEFKDMATIEDSMVMHFWIILTFDPTIFYDQARHAAPEWIFHVYVWSFLVLCGYLLFNIFLAILVDAYIMVRQAALSATPLHEDFAAVVTHAVKALVLPREVFVSDWDLRRRLVLLLNVTQRQRAVLPRRRQVLDLLAAALQHNGRSLHLPGGVEISGRVLRALAKTPAQDPQASAVAPLGGEELADLDDEGNEDWVEELLSRYADPINAAELEASVVADVRAESLKRDLSTYRVHQRVHDAVARVDALLDLVAAKVLGMDALDKARAAAPIRALSNSSSELLQVTVLKARDLPKKDILRALDPFCLVCLTSDPRNPTGKHTYKTRVVTGDRNPEWNERFMFPLATDSRTSPLLSVVVMDFDKCSVDDLVGVVGINVLRDIPAPGGACLEQWFPIQADPPLKSAAVLLRLERLGKPDPSLPSDPPPPASPPPPPALATPSAPHEGGPEESAMELLSVGQGDEQA